MFYNCDHKPVTGDRTEYMF